MIIFFTPNKICYNEITKHIYKFGWVETLEKNIRYILGNILLLQLYFLKNNIYYYYFKSPISSKWTEMTKLD